jgi:glycosyltransferase involved in cell wall biosynthesis
MKISLCIPMYNEEKIIDSTLNTVSSYMDENFGEDYEVLL